MNKPLPANARRPARPFFADELLHALPGARHAPDPATAAGMAASGLRARSTGDGAGLAELDPCATARLACVFNVDVRAANAARFEAVRLRARSLQELADLNLIAHRIAETALVPVLVERDFALDNSRTASVHVPDDAAVADYLGAPDEQIESPTAAQRILFGPSRRRLPALWSTEQPLNALAGLADAPIAWSAGQEPFFLRRAEDIADTAFERFFEHTGRRYQRLIPFHAKDADVLLVASGKAAAAARAAVRHMREGGWLARPRIKVGLLEVVLAAPFPAREMAQHARRCNAVAVPHPMAGAGPNLAQPVAAALFECLNAPPRKRGLRPRAQTAPLLHTLAHAGAETEPHPEAIVEAVERVSTEPAPVSLTLGAAFACRPARDASEEVVQGEVLEADPELAARGVAPEAAIDTLPKDGFAATLYTDADTGAATTWMLADVAGLEVSGRAGTKDGAPYTLAAAPEADALDPAFAPPRLAVFDETTLLHRPLPDLPKGSAVLVYLAPEDAWNQFPPTVQRRLVDREIQVFAGTSGGTGSGLEVLCQRHGAFVKVLNRIALVRGALSRFGDALRTHLEARYGLEDDALLDAAVAAFRAGYENTTGITDKPAPGHATDSIRRGSHLPRALKRLQKTDMPVADTHRYWPLAGAKRAPLASPVTAFGYAPAGVGRFRKGPAPRTEVAWDPAKCTGCGRCWLLGPGGGLAPKAVPVGGLLETAIQLLETDGHATENLRGAARAMEPALRKRLSEAGETADVSACFEAVLAETTQERGEIAQEMDGLRAALRGIPFAVTPAYFNDAGLLLLLTPHPEARGEGADYVPVCPYGALETAPATEEAAARIDKAWRLWLALPNSPEATRTPKEDEIEPGVLARTLLDEDVYLATAAHGAEPATRLFLAALCHDMAPRVRAHATRLKELTTEFEKHLRLRLAETVNLENADALRAALDAADRQPLSLGALSEALEQDAAPKELDAPWLRWAAGVLDTLRRTLHGYETTASAPVAMAGTADEDYGPRNLFPFPWAPLPKGAEAQFAIGLFEGHMARMAEGFRAARIAELELAGRYDPATHDAFFNRFSWRDFTDEETALCPPLALTGAGAFDMSALHGLMASGRPVRVLIVQHTPAPRSGLALAIGHENAFVLQGSISNLDHLADGLAAGFAAHGPALFQVYSPASGAGLAELAVAARACPLYRYDGARGATPEACLDLSGNPGGAQPPAFAEFAVADPRWAGHATRLPGDVDPDRCLSVEEYLELDDDEERAENHACIEQTDADGSVVRVALSEALVRAGETARQTWEMLCALAAQREEAAEPAAETVSAPAEPAAPEPEPVPAAEPPAEPPPAVEPARATAAEVSEDGYVAPWIDSPKCTTCEECVKINGEMFAYDEHRKAYLKNPAAGPYKHLVRAAEKCTEKIIHPGYPPVSQREEKGMAKLMRRAGKFMPFPPPEAGDTVSAPPEPAVPADAPAPPPEAPAEGASAPETPPPAPETPPVESPPAPAAPQAAEDATPIPDEYVAPWIDSPKCTTCEECVKINPDMFAYDEHRKAYIRDPKAGPYKHLVRAAEKCTEKIIRPGYPAPEERSAKGIEKLMRRARKFMK